MEVTDKLIGSLITMSLDKFSKILPISKVYETKLVVAFYHPKPIYKVHILIVPKKVITSIQVLNEDDNVYVLEVFDAVKKISERLGMPNYRLITNVGGYQKVKQLHFHLVSGEADAKV